MLKSNLNKPVFFFLFFFLNISILAQTNFKIAFYNVENLFDTYDNTKINDNEFTPNGSRHWSNYKYWQKVKKCAKVLKIIGGWEGPDIIGLAEIENDTVLRNLIYSDPLKNSNYKIIHRNSPDHRGIDVALLYRKDSFFPISKKFYPLKDKNGNVIHSREIVYTMGIVKGGDTLHIFAIHFPSRYGGYKISEPKRINAVNRLMSIIDSLNSTFKNPKIVIMGDFNDTPNNISIINLDKNKYLNRLYCNHGTHKYQGKWSELDHFFVSNSLLNVDGNIYIDGDTNVFKESFLLEQDKKYMGTKPFRTFVGFKYNGGFSDHLPIFINLQIKNN
jgi:predicted extracellular nuclease